MYKISDVTIKRSKCYYNVDHMIIYVALIENCSCDMWMIDKSWAKFLICFFKRIKISLHESQIINIEKWEMNNMEKYFFK